MMIIKEMFVKREYIGRKFTGLFVPALLVLFATFACGAQNSEGSDKYGRYLKETGSTKPAYAIFTNPAENCTTNMNVSWVTPPGKLWEIELTDVATGETFIYDYDETLGEGNAESRNSSNGKQYKFPFSYRCETFNDIPSKLGDRTSVTEKHIFDKHGLELYDLEPDKEYTYRIVTFDHVDGKKEYSDVHRFKTAGAKAWKAAVISDFHHYAPIWSRIESAMGMLDMINNKAGGFDWVLSPGDQTAHGASFNFWTQLAEQPNYKNFMWASVQGNHDHMASNKKTSDNFFRDSHFFPYNGYQGQEGIAYWFKYGDVLFLMLNNEAMGASANLEKAKLWMENVVAENPSKYIVVVEHYNWLSGMTGSDLQLGRFYQTFDKLGVDLAISGHNHVYLRTAPLKAKQPVAPEEGTVYIVAPSSDNERGREMKSPPSNGDLIKKRWTEGGRTVGGMLMDVNPNRIEMTLYNRNGTVIDSFTVPAKR